MSLDVFCHRCRQVYLDVEPEWVGIDITCRNCGAQFQIPRIALAEEVAAVRRSFRRIFFWSAVLSAVCTGWVVFVGASAPTVETPTGVLVATAGFLFLIWWYSVASFAFGFKALAVESGFLAFLYLSFGSIGAVVGAFFLGPILGPFQAIRMWRWLRRGEGRLVQLCQVPPPCRGQVMRECQAAYLSSG